MNIHDIDFVKNAADRLWDAEKDKAAIAPLTAEHPEISVDVAYRIQRCNAERRVATGDAIVGHKIGLTSAPMQRMLNIDVPDYGHLFRSMHHESGATIDYPLLQPKVEPEIAFVLKEDLVGPYVTIHDVLRATDYVFPAIEVIDSRIRNWQIGLADTIADNASSGCFVVGEQITRPTDVDLVTLGVTMRLNGDIVQTGSGAAVLGHPAAAVAWLANQLAAYDTRLKAGHIVLSGAITAAVAVQRGDCVKVSFGGFGSVEARFA